MFEVRMVRFCSAISTCDCLLQTQWLWHFLLPGVCPWTLERILRYFRETQGLLPGRLTTLTNGKQNSGPETFRSTIVFSLHTCVSFTGKSWTTSFGRNIPTRETDLSFEDLLLPEILTWWERQVFGHFLSNFCYFCNTKSLSRLYRGRDRISISRL